MNPLMGSYNWLNPKLTLRRIGITLLVVRVRLGFTLLTLQVELDTINMVNTLGH